MPIHKLFLLLLLLLLFATNTTAATKQSFYKILDVSKTATKKEIKKAYRTKARLLHPDKNPPADKEKYEQLFVKLAEAYSVLSDDDKRVDYDSGKYDQKFNTNFDEVFKQYGYDGPQDTAANWLVLAITLSLLIVPTTYVVVLKLLKKHCSECFEVENTTRNNLLNARGLIAKTPQEIAKTEQQKEKRMQEEKARNIHRAKEKELQRIQRIEKAEKLAAKDAVAAANIKAHVPVVQQRVKEKKAIQVVVKPSSAPWDNEEKQKFSVACKKYGAGIGDRWSRVAQYIGTRDKAGVTRYVRGLKNLEKQRNTAKANAAKAKEIAVAPTVVAAATASAVAVWTTEEQIKFEEALRQVPRTLSKEKRWTEISRRVGKSRSECVKRFKQLRASLKK